MLRKYLNRHMTGDCPKRATKCTHCGKDFNYDILQVSKIEKIGFDYFINHSTRYLGRMSFE